MAIQIEAMRYSHWGEMVRIANRAAELLVLTEVGPAVKQTEA